MRILNLGCGRKLSPHPDILNVDWTPYLRARRNAPARFLATVILSGQRREFFRSIPDNVLARDLRKGLPFEAGSVDAVYHSHVLEHLDRDAVPGFLREIARVLRPGGIQRIVVPDLEGIVRDYLDDLARCEQDATARAQHDTFVDVLLEQSVRRKSAATRGMGRIKAATYTLLFGDARKRGETHQWMYDRFNLAELLRSSGLQELTVRDCWSSGIPNWPEYGLDVDETGAQYKPGSLYLEARK